jgi:hypothetical protein
VLAAGKTMPSRDPTRSAWEDSALAMNLTVCPVRTVRFADSSNSSDSRRRCGSPTARSREVVDCEWEASSSTGPTR